MSISMGRPPRTPIQMGDLLCVPGSKFALRPGEYQHATRSAYVAGCCCQPCTEAATQYVKAKRHEKLGRPVRPWSKRKDQA